MAFKKSENSKSRLCINFQDLNKIVVPQSQPFPLIEDLVQKTRNCTHFSTLDMNSAFWSILLRIEDRYKTAFVTQEGHFQWTCRPFGLKTAPAIFQRILNNVIRKHKLSDFTVSYIDDILIFSKSFTEHVKHLTKLFEAIKKEGFRLKFSKCTFATDEVKYLGHIIKHNTIRPMNDNLISIKNFPIPKTPKNVRQFLGKITYYHKYIPNAATILDPLHNLLRKGQNFHWSDQCQKTFNKVKDLLCAESILAIFDSTLPIFIYTDASIQGVGAVLKQPQKSNADIKPVAYFSKKLNDAQKKKKAIFLECLAIKEAMTFWQFCVRNKKFTIFSDHKPLEKLNLKARTDEELGDIVFYLSQYDIDIKYCPGKHNVEADCLSRNPVLEENENEEDNLQIVNTITIQKIINDQKNNEEIQKTSNKLLKFREIYYKKSKNKNKIILSEEYSKSLIKRIHEEFCHIGRHSYRIK